MTVQELRESVAWITACIRSIHEAAIERAAVLTDASERSNAEALTADEQSRWDAGTAEIERLNALIARHEQVERMTAAGELRTESAPFTAPNVIVRDDPYSLDGLGFGQDQEIRSRALSALESVKVSGLRDDQREQAEKLIRGLSPELAARVVQTSSPEYRSAFVKMASSGGTAAATLTDGERTALQRAVTLGGTGNLAVPAVLDTTIIDTGSHSTNPFRQICTTKKIVGTSSWKGVSSAGVTASWDGEGVEVSDDAPTLAALDIPVFKGQVFVPFSVESEDWTDMEMSIANMIAISKDDLEGAAFANGNGTSAPQGFTVALDGTAQEIAPTTSETFAKADIDKLEAALDARFRTRASFVANKAWYAGIRAFETTVNTGSLLSRGSINGPGQLDLIGYPAYESSDMDSALPNAAVTADNFGLLFGDFAQAYYIVDRVGLSIELVPHLFHTTTNRPSGMRGFLAWFRTGGEVVNSKAVVMLSIPTAA